MRTLEGEDFSWMDRAPCRGYSEVFYAPEGFELPAGRADREAMAKQFCGSCIVRQECLEFAINTRQEYGIWGGLNEEERGMKALKRAKNA